jgi:hypothetical protein
VPSRCSSSHPLLRSRRSIPRLAERSFADRRIAPPSLG